MSPRIGVLDIETSPLVCLTWGIFDQNISLDQIITDWSIMAYCWKWLDSPKLIYDDTGGRGKGRVRDDRKLMPQLWDLLNEADIVVTQNGKRFDIKKIESRMLIHGMEPYSPIRVIDTLQVAKDKFGFVSNKLAWMSQQLTDTPKSEHKRFPGFELWKECLEDNPAAWAEMSKYNKRDVVATEKVYLAMRSRISNHPNMGIYVVEDDGMVCPKCKSRKLVKRGYRFLQQSRYHRLKCMSCKGWCHTKYNTLPKESRIRLLGN